MSEDLRELFSGVVFAGLLAVAYFVVFRAPRSCKACGHAGKPVLHTPGSLVVELLLWGLTLSVPVVMSWPIFNGLGIFKLPFLLLMLPGPIYTFKRNIGRKNVCAKCGSPDIAFAWKHRTDLPDVGRTTFGDGVVKGVRRLSQHTRQQTRIGSKLEVPAGRVSERKPEQK
jgi:hypothetical protein